MIMQLFGAKGARSIKRGHTNLRNNAQTAQAKAVVEQWAVDPMEALRVNTLSEERAFTSKNIDELLGDNDAIPYSGNVVSIPTLLDRDKSFKVDEPLSHRIVEAILDKKNHLHDKPPATVVPGSLGVFSDSKMYSAMIQQELKAFNVNIKHFNHPKTLTSENFALLDTISAWIVFLSDEDNDQFMDAFFERYGDKETLFLFEKMKRRQTTEKITLFLMSNQLTSEK